MIKGGILVNNRVINGLCHDGRIRVLGCDITDLMKKIVKEQNLLATSACALGRTLAVTSMLGAMLKNTADHLEIRIKGDGPLGLIKTYVNGNLEIRGFVENNDIVLINEHTHKIDVGRGVGKGYLEVVTKLHNDQHFISTINLVSGEIGDDFASYFLQSEQIPSVVMVGVLIDKNQSVVSAGGIIIQMLPGHNELDINSSEEAISHLKPLSTLLADGFRIEDILVSIYNDLEILNTREVKFNCDCNYDKMLMMIDKLPLETLKELNDGHNLNVSCYYCNKEYEIKMEDICELINQRYRN